MAVTTDTRIDVAAYWRDGYSFPHRVLVPGDADRLRRDLERLESDHDDQGPPGPFVEYARANLHVVSTAVAETARDPGRARTRPTVDGSDSCCGTWHHRRPTRAITATS